jgi:hypothetical protein
MNDFTSIEMAVLNFLSEFRNYDNLETELNDNAVGVYMLDIKDYLETSTTVAKEVILSLMHKNMLYPDKVNGTPFFRATDECIEFLYNVLDKKN